MDSPRILPRTISARSESVCMKTIPVTLLVCGVCLAAVNAQVTQNPNFPEPSTRSIATGTARDGFYTRDSKIYMVRNGVTTLVEREILFPNGLRVLPNGTVTLRDGRETTLLLKQWLDFQGSLEDLSAQPVPPPPIAAVARESGVSNRDGITISGAEAFITRNGVTQKLIADVRLPNGVIAKPDGTIVLANGEKVSLRPDQVLDLQGVLRNAPVAPPPPGGGIAPSANQPR